MKPRKHCNEIIAWARGAVIQFKGTDGKWHDTLFNNPTWHETDVFREKPALEDWQLDLIKAIKDGKKVEALIANQWRPAEVLDRLVRHDEIMEYTWNAENEYRVKDSEKYTWCYEGTNGNWYLSSLICDEAGAKVYFEKAGVKNYKKLELVA